ncbi:hypothetical protein VTN31DRAFT_2864 [Thermomyces dupontii]|uniref:uncharacterized protein n=1 Tax=Talaromyces thermophilus TaxID=28565 RepID=UPI0037427236
MAPPYEKYDPELAGILAQYDLPGVINDEFVMRQREADKNFDVNMLLEEFPTLKHEEITIEGANHNRITLSIICSKIKHKAKLPGIYFIHGGGMIFGNRFGGLHTVLPFVAEHNAVCISVEYRLAPEHGGVAALHDCYDGLLWVGKNLKKLGINPKKLLILGRSAGAALAAGTALRMRDRHEGPALRGMVLSFPMLDDRSDTNSCKEFEDTGPWSRQSNIYAWKHILGPYYGTKSVSSYIAPARETNLSDLPSAYIDVGTAEIFRDEAWDFAEKLGNAKVNVELKLWEGGYHCFDNAGRTSQLAQKALDARFYWMRCTLGLNA